SNPQRHFGPEIQGGVYLRGLGGIKPKVPTCFTELEAQARQAMTPEAWAYVAGSAGLETTAEANRAPFQYVAIAPRMPARAAASARSARVAVCGVSAPAPLPISPIGVLEMMHKEADLAVARAASRLGLPMIISSQASFPMEEIAKANGEAPRFFQLYWGKSYS